MRPRKAYSLLVKSFTSFRPFVAPEPEYSKLTQICILLDETIEHDIFLISPVRSKFDVNIYAMLLVEANINVQLSKNSNVNWLQILSRIHGYFFQSNWKKIILMNG
eukprot:Sdes_comp23041_c0_seq1m21378